jgi:hypothetical protein
MSDASIKSWKRWSWQRVIVPLAAAIFGAYRYWGAWKSSADFTCFLIPFGVALWSVFLRIRTRRALLAGGSPFTHVVRSWHSLDLFSALVLAVFETMVQTCSCASLLMQPNYLAFSAILFVIYVGVSGFSQHLLIYSMSQRPNKSPEPTAVTPSVPHSRAEVSGRRWLSFLR